MDDDKIGKMLYNEFQVFRTDMKAGLRNLSEEVKTINETHSEAISKLKSQQDKQKGAFRVICFLWVPCAVAIGAWIKNFFGGS